MQNIESEGRTVAEAVEAALRQHGLRREQVEVTVLEAGSSGFIGIGAKLAKVRLTEKRWGEGTPEEVVAPKSPAPRRASPRPSSSTKSSTPRTPRQTRPSPAPAAPSPVMKVEPPVRKAEAPIRKPAPQQARKIATPSVPLTTAQAKEACEKAQTLTLELLKLMTIAAPSLTTQWDASMERVKIIVESQDAPLLIGRDGRALESLQFLTTLMVSRGAETPIAVQVDALSYWEKREQAILDEAHKAVTMVKTDGRPYRLEPMDASMRRLIHRTLANNPSVTTASEGEGPWRKIVIRLRKE